MTRLNDEQLIRFRERLFQKHIPRLIRSGSEGMNSIVEDDASQHDSKIISTKKLIAFFFSASQKDGSLDEDEYIANLFLFFSVLVKGSEDYTFESNTRVSEKEIQAADTDKIIQYLTNNIIIAYFNNNKFESGVIDTDFLDYDLKNIIKKSNDGRDYRPLIGETLKKLIETLQSDKSWKQCVEDIQKASLICRLIGVSLPQIEKTVLQKIVLKSRTEIKQETDFLIKIINTKAQLIKEEKNQKNYLKTMAKLDTATAGILNKIDQSLGYAHIFMGIIHSSSASFLGDTDKDLKKIVARLFFKYREDDINTSGKTSYLNYAAMRYLMRMLFDYPELTKYTMYLQNEDEYQDCFLNLFRLYYAQLIKQIEHLSDSSDKMDTTIIKNSLFETIRVIKKLGLESKMLQIEKEEVRKRYTSFLKKKSLDQIPDLLAMKEALCRATQDEKKELFGIIRVALIDNCYEALISLERGSSSTEEYHKVVRKLIIGYSLHYQPVRFFYRNFYDKYIAKPDDSLTTYFSSLISKNKILAVSILTFFSDPNYVADLISNEQIEFSEQMIGYVNK